MINRLQELCQSFKWTYTPSVTTSSVDGVFNGQRAQLKYSSAAARKGRGYQVALFKRVNRIVVPYSVDDFDVLVVMIKDVSSFVYVIPMWALAKAGVVSSSTSKGTTVIYLFSPLDTSGGNRFYRFICPPPPPQVLDPLQTLCSICHVAVLSNCLTDHQKSKTCMKWR